MAAASSPNKPSPRIWFNLTTSHNWNRPPVGIIRVETNAYAELRKLYGEDMVLPCVFIDGQFVRLDKEPVPDRKVNAMLANIVPESPSFDVSHNYVYRLVKFLTKTPTTSEEKATIEDYVKSQRLRPGDGDIFVTMGLDWDYGFKEKLFEMRTRGNLKIVTCCYDLIPALFPQYCVNDVSKYFKEYFYNMGWGSDLVLCISKQSQKDFESFMRLAGMPAVETQVIELGDSIASKKVKDKKKTESRLQALIEKDNEDDDDISDDVAKILEEDFILFVSTIERRKNHEVLYRAYHLLRMQGHTKLPKLVFVGMHGWGVDELMKDMSLDPLVQDDIVRLNHVSDFELKTLYEKALFLTFPSLYEGWGLPVGEAMSVGQFVLSSDRGSLPEVGGDLVTYLDPWHAQAWADEILKYVTDRDLLALKKKAVKKSYKPRTWSDTVKPLKPIFDKLLQKSASKWAFEPGYDLKTLVGISDQGAIRTTRQAGFLMFGPNMSLCPGRYEVRILSKIKSGTLTDLAFDIVHRGGNEILMQFDLGNAKEKEFHLTKVILNLEDYVADLEVRAAVTRDMDMSIHEVSIERL